MFPRDTYPRLKKTVYLAHDFHSLVCIIHQISLAKTDFMKVHLDNSMYLSPLKIQIKEKHLSSQERPEPGNTDMVRCFI